MPCTTLSPEYPSDPIRPDACGCAEEAPRQAYATVQPFFATAMTLGEFRSRHHHAGYDGFDSERGFLVELPAGEGAEVPSQPPPKVWIDADTFARTYHRTGARTSRTASEHDAAYVTTEAYRVSIPRGSRTDPQAWSDITGQAMPGSPTPEEAPPAYMGGCCTQGPSTAAF